MSATINLRGAISADIVIDELIEAGASVIWKGAKPSAATVLHLTTTVDTEDAHEAIPGEWFSNDNEEWSEPEADDLCAFIAACQAGDRGLAMALLRRLNLSEGAAERGERILLAIGARA